MCHDRTIIQVSMKCNNLSAQYDFDKLDVVYQGDHISSPTFELIAKCGSKNPNKSFKWVGALERRFSLGSRYADAPMKVSKSSVLFHNHVWLSLFEVAWNLTLCVSLFTLEFTVNFSQVMLLRSSLVHHKPCLIDQVEPRIMCTDLRYPCTMLEYTQGGANVLKLQTLSLEKTCFLQDPFTECLRRLLSWTLNQCWLMASHFCEPLHRMYLRYMRDFPSNQQHNKKFTGAQELHNEHAAITHPWRRNLVCRHTCMDSEPRVISWESAHSTAWAHSYCWLCAKLRAGSLHPMASRRSPWRSTGALLSRCAPDQHSVITSCIGCWITLKMLH